MSKTLRAVAFVDGQNLFNTTKECFGYNFPNYDIGCLSSLICRQKNWQLKQVRFYTGLPSIQYRPKQHFFWNKKLTAMRRQKIWVFTRDVKYIQNAEGYWVGREKGVDVKLAIDVISLAFEQHYDVALIFSQDQDFVEAAEAVRQIAQKQNRFIKVASAFPRKDSPRCKTRGIDKTDWIPFDKKTYDQCIDLRDYR